jgi:hypothetical protein
MQNLRFYNRLIKWDNKIWMQNEYDHAQIPVFSELQNSTLAQLKNTKLCVARFH